jgi:histidinol-phosphate aminotransferase
VNLAGLMRSDLSDLRASIPGTPVLPPGRAVFKLDANENPYGPSPRVREALAGCGADHYPDPTCTALRQEIAGYLGVDPDSVACSAGCDEMIDLLLRLVLDPGDEVITLTPSFVMYEFCTASNHGKTVRVPRGEGFAVDVAAVQRAISGRTKAIFLCSPNNPTGNLTPRSDVIALLETGRLVVVDEAYAEFAGCSIVDLAKRYSNLVVLRTMSKWGALAGLRLGYAVLSPQIRTAMEKIRSPFNVGAAAQAAGIVTLQDRAYLAENVRRLVLERERLYDRLLGFEWGHVFPSRANFLYWETGGMDAEAVRDGMAAEGVLVRAFPGALRIGVGTPEATEAVMASLTAACTALMGAAEH